MQTRNNLSSLSEETIVFHKGQFGKLKELSTITLEELGSMVYQELLERSNDYQAYLESFNNSNPESKL